MMVKKTKKAGAKHSDSCVEVAFPSDNRYTKCDLCGKARFYPAGYKGEINFVRVQKGKGEIK